MMDLTVRNFDFHYFMQYVYRDVDPATRILLEGNENHHLLEIPYKAYLKTKKDFICPASRTKANNEWYRGLDTLVITLDTFNNKLDLALCNICNRLLSSYDYYTKEEILGIIHEIDSAEIRRMLNCNPRELFVRVISIFRNDGVDIYAENIIEESRGAILVLYWMFLDVLKCIYTYKTNAAEVADVLLPPPKGNLIRFFFYVEF